MKKIFYFAIALLFSCETNIENKEQSTANNAKDNVTTQPVKDSVATETKVEEKTSLNYALSSPETYLRNFGLVDIQEIEPQIRVDLKYSTLDNFVGIDLYGDLDKAFCQPDVAEKILRSLY